MTWHHNGLTIAHWTCDARAKIPLHAGGLHDHKRATEMMNLNYRSICHTMSLLQRLYPIIFPSVCSVLSHFFPPTEMSCIYFSVRRKVRAENGPPLRVGCQLCWSIELQVFPSFLGMLFAYLTVGI